MPCSVHDSKVLQVRSPFGTITKVHQKPASHALSESLITDSSGSVPCRSQCSHLHSFGSPGAHSVC